MAPKTYPRIVDLLDKEIPAKISRNEFSRVTGINRNSLDRYKAGLGTPILETLQKLSDYFGVSKEWLRGANTKTPDRITALLKGHIKDIGIDKVVSATGLKAVTINLLYRDKAEPNDATTQKLAAYFVVSADWLNAEGDYDILNADGTFDFNRVPSEAQLIGQTNLIQLAHQPAHKYDAETWLLCADAVETIMNKEESREGFKKLLEDCHKKK